MLCKGLSASEEQRCFQNGFLLMSIFAVDDDTVWVGGGYREERHATEHTRLYVTHDAGHTWQQRGPDIINSAIFSLFFWDMSTGWALGAWTQESTGEPFVLRTQDGGMHWQRSDIPVHLSSKTLVHDPKHILFLSPDIGLVQTTFTNVEDESAIFLSHDGGHSWTFSHGRAALCQPENWLSRTPTGQLWKLKNGCVAFSTDQGVTWHKAPHQPSEP